MRRTAFGGRSRTRIGGVLAALALVWGCGSDTPTNPGPNPTPTNQAPSADAGADLTVSVGYAIGVDGSGSTDPDGDALSYAWTLTAPSGSSATLDDAADAAPSFLPDVEGAYALSLTVNDGTADSGADALTVTAVNNTVTSAITAATGGTIVSSDGAMTMSVPAGALAADTDIGVSLLADAQLPDVVRAMPGTPTAYDLQPDGTMFSSPVEVAFDVPGAVTSTSGSVSMSGALLRSESGGTVESMANVVMEQDAVDPSRASLTGELSHFSHALFVAMSMEFRIDAPDEVQTGEPFDVTFTIDITGAGLGSVVAATVQDESQASVYPEPGFDPDLQGSPTVVSVTNAYMCDQAGEGRIVGRMQFESDDPYGSIVTVQLGKPVQCVPGLETSFVGGMLDMGRLLPVSGSNTDITTGGAVRRMNLQSGAVTFMEAEGDGNPQKWVMALTDGSYLVHSILGKVFRYDPSDQQNAYGPNFAVYDTGRQLSVVGANQVVLASSFGDLGLITHGGGDSFSDAFRDLNSFNAPQQPGANLQAVWATSGASTLIGAYTEGDGDSAFNDTRAAILVRGAGSSWSTVPLPGVIDLVLDTQVRHQMAITCREQSTQLFLCVFTAGFDAPASNNTAWDRVTDGFVAVFTVDTFTQTATVIRRLTGTNGRVGGAIFPVDGTTTGVAFANQASEAIDVWHVQGDAIAREMSFDISQNCRNPIDLITIADGALGAVACESAVTYGSGVLVVRNLHQAVPTGS